MAAPVENRQQRIHELAEWTGSTLGRSVVRASGLRGGMSSLVISVELAASARTASTGTASSATTTEIVVARQIEDDEWLAREPDLIVREAIALRAAASCELTTPMHLGNDGERRLVMSHVPGGMGPDTASLRNRAARLGRAAAAIARTPLGPDHGLPAWRSWVPEDPRPPTWGDPPLSDSPLWQDAIAAWGESREPQCERPVLLHRDLHPLNVLWDRRLVSASPLDGIGVVDWINACVGHPHAELGHTRWNLAVLAGDDAVTSFTDSARSNGSTPEASAEYDPRWDLATVLSFLPDGIGVEGWFDVGRLDLIEPVVIERTEAFLRAALERI